MIGDLFVNMTIIISFISIVSQLLKKYEINREPSIKVKIIIGTITGVLGVTLMKFSVHVTENTIIDFRNVVIALAAIQGGTLPVIICGSMIAVFRIVYFGVNLSSTFGVVSAAIVAGGCALIARSRIKTFRKWIYATLYSLTVSSIILIILLKGKTSLPKFLLIYWSTTFMISMIVSYYSDYCLTANTLFRKLQFESSKDFLTELNNVRSFDRLYNHAIKNAKEKGEDLSLLMIDIDFFKKVNDTYGHAEGDIVLQELGKILSRGCRSFDIVSRNGGEEFTVLLLDCPKSQAIKIAEHIRSSVEGYPFVLSKGIQIAVTVSIGVASYQETTDEIERLLELADMALYCAKRAGRNRVYSYGMCSPNPKGVGEN